MLKSSFSSYTIIDNQTLFKVYNSETFVLMVARLIEGRGEAPVCLLLRNKLPCWKSYITKRTSINLYQTLAWSQEIYASWVKVSQSAFYLCTALELIMQRPQRCLYMMLKDDGWSSSINNIHKIHLLYIHCTFFFSSELKES